MTSLTDRVKQRTLLLQCLAVSVAIHLVGLIYFYTHPIVIQSTWKSLFGLSSAPSHRLEYEEENAQINAVIEDAFEHLVVLPHQLQSPLDLVELPQGIALAPSAEEEMSSSIPFDADELFFEEEMDFDPLAQTDAFSVPEGVGVEPLFLPEQAQFEVASPFDLDIGSEIAPIDPLPLEFFGETSSSEADRMTLSELAFEATPEVDTSGINLLDRTPGLALEEEKENPLKTDTRSQLGKISSQEIAAFTPSASAPLFAPHVPPLTWGSGSEKGLEITSPLLPITEYAFPALATASQWNDDFDVALQFFPKEEGEGYTFSITLTPAFDVTQHSLKQNIYFVLDRSNSVQKHRFAVFKRAIIKALASMQPGDFFNIYVVDKKIIRLNPVPLKCTAKALRAAEEFLEKQEAGGHFATADIYAGLDKILPEAAQDDEIHTAILLTDGHSSFSASKQQQHLRKWVEKNNSTLSLYTAAVGQGNNLVMLDLLSAISGGRLLYSDTHASFPRKLAKLILDLRYPLANDMIVTATPDQPNAHIEIQTASSHLPSLYSLHPYVIIGTIDKPSDFDLVVQGRRGGEWISIRKTISFDTGEKATRSQAKKWDAMQANLHYSQFLKEGKADHLKQAKEILKTTRTEIAFE